MKNVCIFALMFSFYSFAMDYSTKPSILSGHSKPVYGMDIASNDLIATASSDHMVYIWNPEIFSEPVKGFQHPCGVLDVSWSPNAEHLMTLADDEKVRIWDFNSGIVLQILPGRGAKAIAFSPCGTYKAISCNTAINLYDRHGELLGTLVNHKADVLGFSWSPKSDYLVSYDAAGIICLWDIAFQTLRQELHDQSDQPYNDNYHRITDRWLYARNNKWPITAIAFSPDGAYIAVKSLNGVTIWNALRLNVIDRFPAPDFRPLKKSSLSWSPDSSFVMAHLWNGSTQIYHISTGQRVVRHDKNGTLLTTNNDPFESKRPDVRGDENRHEKLIADNPDTVWVSVWSKQNSFIVWSTGLKNALVVQRPPRK